MKRHFGPFGLRHLVRSAVAFASGQSHFRASSRATDIWLYPWAIESLLEENPRFFEPLDSAGVPGPPRGFPPGSYIGSRVGGFALAHWNRWRRLGDLEDQLAFIDAARWFAQRPNGLVQHHFAVGDLVPPWLSCVAQGQALSVLARLYYIKNEEAVLERATRAAAPLFVPVDQGGLLGRLPDGSPFFEEYPKSRHTHVLNGCITAILGLFDLARSSTETEVPYREFALEVARAIASNLALWDLDGWSLYGYEPNSRVPNANTPNYHRLHVILLKALEAETGIRQFSTFAERWSTSERMPLRRASAFVTKVRYRAVSGW